MKPTAFKTIAVILAASVCWLGSVGAKELTGITPVEEISVPNGTPLTDALTQLPATTTVVVGEGDTMEVELTWALSEYVVTSRGGNIVRQAYMPSVRGPYEMTGTFALPPGLTPSRPDMPLNVKATVNVEGGELVDLNNEDVFDQPGEYGTVTMDFNGVARTFSYYIPSIYTGDVPVPVMFTFHGGGSYALGQLAYSEFDVLAEQENFIVIAPDYGASALGRFTTPGLADFTSAIIDRMETNYNIDSRRIYASGISMGGSASFTLAHELPDRIAAVAPVASSAQGLLEQQLPRPIPIVWFYGTRDSRWGPDMVNTVEHLVTHNKAAEKPGVKTWTPTADDPTGITRLTYTGGENGADVIFYRIDEGGHTWPGKYQYSSLINVGLTSQHIDASEVIWEHLKEYRLPE